MISNLETALAPWPSDINESTDQILLNFYNLKITLNSQLKYKGIAYINGTAYSVGLYGYTFFYRSAFQMLKSS